MCLTVAWLLGVLATERVGSSARGSDLLVDVEYPFDAILTDGTDRCRPLGAGL